MTRYAIDTMYHFVEQPSGKAGGHFVWVTHRITRIGEYSAYTPMAGQRLFGITWRGETEFQLYITLRGDVPKDFEVSKDEAKQIVDNAHREVRTWKTKGTR